MQFVVRGSLKAFLIRFKCAGMKDVLVQSHRLPAVFSLLILLPFTTKIKKMIKYAYIQNKLDVPKRGLYLLFVVSTALGFVNIRFYVFYSCTHCSMLTVILGSLSVM